MTSFSYLFSVWLSVGIAAERGARKQRASCFVLRVCLAYEEGVLS